MEVKTDIDFVEHYGVYYGQRLIDFSVIRRSRRTLQISVLPDRTVEVTAPNDSTEEAIRERVQRRASWIVRQQNWFKQFDPRTPARFYVGGETHLYLGRRYRLKITGDSENGVRLVSGHFKVNSKNGTDPACIQKLLEDWYRKQAVRIFNEIYDSCIERFEIRAVPRLQIKNMKTRWGSLSKGGVLTLNPQLIRAPKECIEYVITHELCHLEEHNHGQRFYKLLESRMADWEKRKVRLEAGMV